MSFNSILSATHAMSYPKNLFGAYVTEGCGITSDKPSDKWIF